MTAANFEPSMVAVKPHEGGYVNHKKDPGGETNFGISKRAYPHLDIKNLTWTKAKGIYRADYWNPIKGDLLPKGIDYVTLDPAINSGVSRGVKWLQAALGVTQDGHVGVKTVEAARKADPVKIVKLVCAKRSGWLRGLKTWSTFGKGWARRVAEVEVTAVKMAGGNLQVETVTAKTQAKKADAAAFTVAPASGGVVSLADIPTWAMGLGAVALIVLLVVLFGERFYQHTRVKAYADADV